MIGNKQKAFIKTLILTTFYHILRCEKNEKIFHLVHIGKALNATTSNVARTKSESQCLSHCLYANCCQSVNVEKLGNKDFKCHLFNGYRVRVNGFRVTSNTKYFETPLNDNYNKDCLSLYLSGEKKDGVYEISPDGSTIFNVWCDMTTDGGGWTAFIKRTNATLSFDENWLKYKDGFGSVNGDFWLGNDYIHSLTKEQKSEFRVDMVSKSKAGSFAKYSNFQVGSENTQYRLTIEGYDVTSTDVDVFLINNYYGHLNGMKFSTKDKDNDNNAAYDCATTWGNSGWWYNSCHYGYLTGPYTQGSNSEKIISWGFNKLTSCIAKLKRSEC